MKLRALWRTPSALQLATYEYEEALRDRLAQVKLREYHAAMEQMLVERIERLRSDISELSKDGGIV